MNRQQSGNHTNHTIVGVILCAGILLRVCHADIISLDVEAYENMWIVVVGNHLTYEEAESVNESGDYSGVILSSTFFSNLRPGWFMLVRGMFKTQDEAKSAAERITSDQDIESYVRFTGDLYDFHSRLYRMHELTESLKRIFDENGYRYSGFTSIDGTMTVEFQGHCEDPSTFPVVKMEDQELYFEGLYVYADELIWAPGGQKFAFIDRDFYAGSGDLGVVVIDIQTEKDVYVELQELTAKEDFNGREMLCAYDVKWLPSEDGMFFSLDVDFLGYSGHPGIDMTRQERLGEDFGRNDPVKVGDFAVFIEPR